MTNFGRRNDSTINFFKKSETYNNYSYNLISNKNNNNSTIESTSILSNSSSSSNETAYNFKFNTNNSVNEYNNFSDKPHPKKFKLLDDTSIYFKELESGKSCFIDGTNFNLIRNDKCICNKGYNGKDCGIPDSVWHGNIKHINKKIMKRSKPRRIIHGFPVHHEFEMFEARMYELFDIVDVFIITESNYTSHRDPKPLEFYNRFIKGYMEKYHHKIIYILLDHSYKYGDNSGWASDNFIRYFMGKRGLDQIEGIQDDDLFLLTDADEIPLKEVITFLKLYEGYPEPVGLAYRWNIFGFYWKYPSDKGLYNWLMNESEKLSIVFSLTTIKMLRDVFKENILYIRKDKGWQMEMFKNGVKEYRSNGGIISEWIIGSIGHYAGWHCSWCFSPRGVIKKLDAAQAEDKPRWGDYPEKKNIKFIENLISNGLWFDEKLKFVPCNSSEHMYAPKYFMEHAHNYSQLLSRPK